MKRPASLAIAAGAAALAIIGCDGDDGAQWYDELGRERLDGVVVFEDGPVRLVDVTVPTYDCEQLLVGDVVGFCPELAPGSAMGPIPMRSDGTEVIWMPTAFDVASEPARFVVFSSSSPGGRSIEPLNVGEISHLIWRLEPDEAPWGIQVLDVDGALRSASTIGDLPD